ncbi:hypothetical protein AALP_AA8G365700 [Arabis alpina]|uniref:Pectinesterase n=1 Tax=Arabis alpina TaxID=50452 RepID=A0A087GBQ7_ARAAL|nr:hypothetical protein AALP_AA8G365700 [Arabis alpina]
MSEIGVSFDSLQSMLRNITIDVINASAINKGMKTNKNGFGISKVLAMETPSTTSGRLDVVVAQDGSGDYKTIQEAVDGAGERPKGSRRYVLRVKEGVYEEYVKVGIKSNNIMIVGDGISKTIITGNKSNGTGFSTFQSATFVAEGDGLVARDMTIRNTAGPENHQAVALRSDSDMSAFYKRSIEGYQDTLYVHSNRQFFKECDIYGTVDFIFGNAAAVFQNGRIFARRPPNGVDTITAHSRENTNQTTGFVIQNSVVRGAPGVRLGGVKTYMGRPWRAYARTVVIGTHIGSLIEPKGWIEWDYETDLSTLYYGEYRNLGPGSGTENRVDWAGFHVITDIQEVQKFTLSKFIDGASWLPQTRIPFSIIL